MVKNLPTMTSLKKIETKHNGSLGHWVGKLLHIVGSTRFDIAYAVTRLSGYVTNPIKPAFQILHHLMEYLHHHPHFPIMYPNTKSPNNIFSSHFWKGEAEINKDKKIFTNVLKSHGDSDFCRDLSNRQ